MEKGFITMATGDLNYFVIARNLLRSYKQNGGSKPFAIITDRENEYTDEFDTVIVLETPSHSWMDKLELLKLCPYDENIFIDADCIIYKNIDILWDVFQNADDFSCFGEALPLNSEKGWFKQDGVGSYKIHFITHLHGMLYYLRKSETLLDFYSLSKQIVNDYASLTFNMFNDKLADEPVFALAMSVLNQKPVKRQPNYYCFVPFATNIKTDYISRTVMFTNPKDGLVDNCFIVHWGSGNTKKYQYLIESNKINYLERNPSSLLSKIHNILLYDLKLLLMLYKIKNKIKLLISH